MQGDVGAAEEIRATVEICALRGGIEANLAHAKASLGRVAPSVGDDLIEERIFGRPETRLGDRDGLSDGFGFAGGESDLGIDLVGGAGGGLPLECLLREPGGDGLGRVVVELGLD